MTQTADGGLEKASGTEWLGPEEAHLLAEFLPIAFVFYDTGGGVVYINDAFTRLYGWTLADLAGQRIDFVPEYERERTAAATARVLAGERVILATQRFTRQGKLLDVVVRTATLVDRSGAMRGTYVLHEDITETKATAEALEETQHRYRQLLDASPDAISVYDASGHITYLNPKFTELFGWSLGEVSGRGIDFVPAAEQECTADAVRRTLAGERVLLDTQRLTKGGRTLDIQLHTTAFYDAVGALAGDLVIYRDVTEQRRLAGELDAYRQHLEERVAERTGELRDSNRRLQAEVEEHQRTQRALRDNEERFRQLAEMLPEIVFEMDLAGQLTFVNQQALVVTGFSEAELLGGFRALDLLAEADRSRAAANLQKIWRDEVPAGNEYTLQRKDGSGFPVMAYSSPLVRGGQLQGFRGIVVDTSRAKQMEGQLRHAAKMEAVATLAGGVAHDFNNILQAIIGYVQLLQNETGTVASRRRMVDQIGNAAARASNLVRSLLTFSRREPVHLIDLELNGVVREAMALLEHTLPAGVALRVELGEALPAVHADATQLTQALMNLGANARDAMPQGGTLTLATSALEVDEDFAARHPETRPGRYLRLVVRDTGLGMSAEHVAQAFDPFFTTKEVGKGTGLGLAATYGIVKDHGGTILCQSSPGQGTEFQIFLPARDGAPTANTPREKDPQRRHRRGDETVLLVDGQPELREMGRAMLERYGYRVVEAASGEDALACCRREGANLAVLDLDTPGLAGEHGVQRLLEYCPALRVVVARGDHSHATLSEEASLGVHGFVTKPYRLADLVDTVRQVLDAAPRRPG